MENCYAYLRVSSTSQKDKDGFTRQEKAISDYAKSNTMSIVQIFKEDFTGTEEARPVLAELMVTLEKNGHDVKTVIIEKLDRLARDLMVQEAIIRDFKKMGFNLISAYEGPDLCADDPTRKLMRQMMGAMSEYEKNMIVLKLLAARQRVKQRTGKCEGRKSYKESEAGREIVKKIHKLRKKPKYSKRMTWQQIADSLNTEGTFTMDGKQWTFQRVQQTYIKAQDEKN